MFYNPHRDGIRSTQSTPITKNLPTKQPKEVVYADATEGDMIFFHSVSYKSPHTKNSTAFNITITEK